MIRYNYIFMPLFLCIAGLCGQDIAIIGCGHLGLTMAAVFAQAGHSIYCFDINTQKINQLQQHQLPLYEPDLDTILFHSEKNITFCDDQALLTSANIFYICVDTPIDHEGNADCSAVYKALTDIVHLCTNKNTSSIICIKSTVKPGTMHTLQEQLKRMNARNIELVYNPEFMREGSALHDIHYNNPIILGGNSADAIQTIEHLYVHDAPIIKTNFESAEIIKYAWNSFSAMRVAYVNELALLCRAIHGDITTVVQGMALSETLLPTEIIKPGPGYGGSCLPKETTAFAHLLHEHNISCPIIEQVIASNTAHQKRIVEDIYALLDTLHQNKKIITILGLAFKANTNDIRNAPAINILHALVKQENLEIRAYDLHAIPAMQKLFPQVSYFTSPYDAINGTDCIVILTDCTTISKIPLDTMAYLCNNKLLLDTKNIYKAKHAQSYNFTYIGMGN